MATITVRDAYLRTLDFQRRGLTAEAELGFRNLVAARPAFAAPRVRLVGLLWESGRREEALAHQRELVRLQPEPEHEFGLASQLLALGQFKEGWPLYETRAMLSAGSTRPGIAVPEWRGEQVSSLVVWDEQGAGDTIQFSRFLPRLAERVGSVTFVCRPPLAPLMGGLGANVIPATPSMVLPPFDSWVMLGSLPHHLGIALEDLATLPAYLAAPSGRTPPDGVAARIGLVGRGNPRHDNDLHRSLTDEAWRRLTALPGSVSLHPGEVFNFRDFADTAAVIAELDLVISVDTSVAHLAGAMGKPVWVLLPQHRLDWRWMAGQGASPWYPSARLYRQERPMDWSGVLDQVEADLAGSGLI